MQKIRIYRPPGREPEFDTFLLAQEPRLRRKLCRQLILLQQTPLCEWKEPHYKHFALEKYNRLYELREKSRILVRIIFTIYDGDILLLVPFVKHQLRDTMRSLEAVKVTGTGHNYFVPRQSMEKVGVLEDFIEAVNDVNEYGDARLSVNSFYIIDDAKQRDKMTEEFYSSVRREISAYQERADYLIQSGSTSPTVMERWINKISALEGKKRHYEDILRRELDGLDDEFETLKFLSQELSIRAKGLRAKRGEAGYSLCA